jgi:hypothetical protein
LSCKVRNFIGVSISHATISNCYCFYNYNGHKEIDFLT